jgi:hypothetical protein
MGELQGELPLVGEQQRSAAVGIQAADGVEAAAKIGGEEIKHDGTSVGIVTAADHTFGLIEEQEPWWIGRSDRFTIDADAIGAGGGFVAELSDLAVHADAALPQQIFGMASGADSSGGDHLLQSLDTLGSAFW